MPEQNLSNQKDLPQSIATRSTHQPVPVATQSTFPSIVLNKFHVNGGQSLYFCTRSHPFPSSTHRSFQQYSPLLYRFLSQPNIRQTKNHFHLCSPLQQKSLKDLYTCYLQLFAMVAYLYHSTKTVFSKLICLFTPLSNGQYSVITLHDLLAAFIHLITLLPCLSPGYHTLLVFLWLY